MHLLSTLIEFSIKFNVFLVAKVVKLIYCSKPYFSGLAMGIFKGTAICFPKINKRETLCFSNCTLLFHVDKLNIIFLSFINIHISITGSKLSLPFFTFHLMENAYIRRRMFSELRDWTGVLLLFCLFVCFSNSLFIIPFSSNTEISPLLHVKTFDFRSKVSFHSRSFHSKFAWNPSDPIMSTDWMLTSELPTQTPIIVKAEQQFSRPNLA